MKVGHFRFDGLEYLCDCCRPYHRIGGFLLLCDQTRHVGVGVVRPVAGSSGVDGEDVVGRVRVIPGEPHDADRIRLSIQISEPLRRGHFVDVEFDVDLFEILLQAQEGLTDLRHYVRVLDRRGEAVWHRRLGKRLGCLGQVEGELRESGVQRLDLLLWQEPGPLGGWDDRVGNFSQAAEQVPDESLPVDRVRDGTSNVDVVPGWPGHVHEHGRDAQSGRRDDPRPFDVFPLVDLRERHLEGPVDIT